MFEPMPDDDDDDELDDVGLLTREAPAAKATKAKSAPREKPAPKSSAWELTGNAELDALFQSSTLTARSLNVAASRPSTTGPSSGKPLRSTPVEVPLSRAEKILAKLAEQKEEDDKESKKLDRQRKRVEDDARAEAAAASARAAAEAHDARVAAQLRGATQLKGAIDEKAARVEAALADAGDGSDETPAPRDVARAMYDDAFEPDACPTPVRHLSDPRDSCVANMPRSARDAPSDAKAIAVATEADARRRGADAGDAVAHALREAIVGGWLEQGFLIARRDGVAGAAGGGGEGEAKRKDASPVFSRVVSAAAAILGGSRSSRESASPGGLPAALVRAPPVCAEDTARWLFQTATAPSSARDAQYATICARNALYAALGFEPNPALAAAPRWLCGTPELRAPPAVPWRVKASDVIEALGRCGVVVDVDVLGDSLGKGAPGVGGGRPGAAAKRKRPAAAAAVGEGGEGDRLAALSGRGEGDREATVQLYRDERRRLRPQIFAAVQIAGAAAAAARWTPRRGRSASATVTPVKGKGSARPTTTAAAAVRDEGPHCWVRDDPAGVAHLLAVLAGLRIDPRAGAVHAAVDHCAENILAAAALGCDGDEWRAFRSAAASKLARVGPTHAARLAAIRWLPWSTRKEQEVQDLAAIVAIESLVPLVLERLEAHDAATTTTKTHAAKKKKPRPNSKAKKPAEKSARDDDVDAWQRRAVQALDPVRVDVESDVDAAWAMHTAVHLADIVLHAGTLGGGTGLRGGSLGVNGAPRTPGKEAAECASLDAAAESFMRFLKRTKANIPRSGKTAMNALKNLAVVIFTRQQRAEQLRRTKTEHERANSSGEDSDGEDEDE